MSKTKKGSASTDAQADGSVEKEPAGRKKAAKKRRAGKGQADRTAARSRIPVVGIGASAGGLEAFTELLGALPGDTGMAFVLISHLNATRLLGVDVSQQRNHARPSIATERTERMKSKDVIESSRV